MGGMGTTSERTMDGMGTKDGRKWMGWEPRVRTGIKSEGTVVGWVPRVRGQWWGGYLE